PASVAGDGALCHGNPVNLSSSGGTSSPEAVDLWFEGSCDDAYVQLWNTQPFTRNNTTVNSVNGILDVESTSNDPMINMFSIGSFDPNTYKYINVRYRVVSGTAGFCQIFFNNPTYPVPTGPDLVQAPLNSDGAWHTVSLDMSANAAWDDGNITDHKRLPRDGIFHRTR
ncbi:MAG TPA: hypothetical protein DDW91_07575, partial [Shewanella frigidimarina]|nr:hypothetical protein [Shewanella frigidimarina]